MAVLFGARGVGGRIGITKPQLTYTLGRPIQIWLYYDSALMAPKRPVGGARYPVGQGLNPTQDLPPGFFGTDSVSLTHPDGSVSQFPADTRIDVMFEPKWFWLNGQGVNVDYQLERFIRAPGLHRMRWKLGDLESPEISFRVIK